MTAMIFGKAMSAGSALAVALALGAGAAAAQATNGSDLPGGATSLNESHGDWTVSCRVVQDKDKQQVKSCAMSQQQVNKQKQRALEVSLVPQKDGSARGVILLPFGLAVTKGVTVDVDGDALGKPMDFSTCVPVGCLVPVDFDTASIKKIAKGQKMQISAVAPNGQKITLAASLNGFTSAFNRTGELLK